MESGWVTFHDLKFVTRTARRSLDEGDFEGFTNEGENIRKEK